MDLEGLKAAWEKAQADLAKSPEDKALIKAEADAKAAYEKAKAEAEENDDDDDDNDPESKLAKLSPEELRKQIKSLRKENAGHRTKNKSLKDELILTKDQKKKMLAAAGIVEDDEKPEEKLKTATEQNNSLAFRNAVLETAVAHGIPKEKLKFFQYLMSEAVAELEDGDELSDEKLEEIVKECKAGGGKQDKANSTVKRKDKDGNPIEDPAPGEKGDMTLEKFLRMGVVERSALYLKSPGVYEEFKKQAKAKGKLV